MKKYKHWERLGAGRYFCRQYRLVIELSPDDGWWYVMRSNARGDVLPGQDALAWATSLAGAKEKAEKEVV